MKKLIYILALAMVSTPVIASACDVEDQIHALAMNMYHEARGEGHDAMQMVGEVTLNRVESKHFPNNVCGVVYQARFDNRGNPRRHQCQFSWFCDGRSDRPHNRDAWEDAMEIAEGLINGTIDPIGIDATHYHTTAVNPYWAKRYTMVGRYGDHVFYQMGNRL